MYSKICCSRLSRTFAFFVQKNIEFEGGNIFKMIIFGMLFYGVPSNDSCMHKDIKIYTKMVMHYAEITTP